jgi:hypothetical protein
MDRGENYIIMNFMACILHLVLLGLLIKEGEVGGTCGTHGEGRGVYGVLEFGGRPKGKRPREDLGIDGANWIRLAQDRVQWRAFVNTVRTFAFNKESRLLFDTLSNYQRLKEYLTPWS